MHEEGKGHNEKSPIKLNTNLAIADSGAGSVDVEVPLDDGAYDVQAEAGLGEVDLAVRVEVGAPRRIEARSGAGSVRVHYP